jgi:hypothetical protein
VAKTALVGAARITVTEGAFVSQMANNCRVRHETYCAGSAPEEDLPPRPRACA